MYIRRNGKGFTLAEVLIVALIVVILAALIFVGVFAYLRSMTKTEYDGYAREIFIAAQNHLTMADHQGYLGRTYFGTEEPGAGGAGTGVYYVSSTTLNDASGILGLMLPPGAVDEKTRTGGSYIIRYHKDAGQVMDVFYWSETAKLFSHVYVGEYDDFLSKKNDKSALKTYGSDRSVIGYYGGADAATLTYGAALYAPAVTVKNAETLTVTVDNTNITNPKAKLKLLITGTTEATKNITKEIVLEPSISDVNVSYDALNQRYVVTLDDVTNPFLRFNTLYCSGSDGNLIPGEDIVIKAVAYNNTELTNVAYSTEYRTNSLFAGGTTEDTAKIACFRHLENLDAGESNVSVAPLSEISISKAEQVTDLVWTGFTGAFNESFAYSPVNPGYALDYDGGSFSITGLTVTGATSAGVFGDLEGGSISNLELVDVSVSGYNAGALAGTAEGTTVSNVLAITGGSSAAATVTGSGSVGGLVGSAVDCRIEYSAAALVVESTAGSAGGLVGGASGATRIYGCYSGGHTEDGVYTSYNVTAGGSAGGLVGSFSGVSIDFSYSTCSATGGIAGGLAGYASGTVSNCYATGLVSGATEGAFAGLLTGVVSDSYYFEIINERSAEGAPDGSKGYVYLKAVGDSDRAGVTAIDINEIENNEFSGAAASWISAFPYDSKLDLYYRGKYNLQTVSDLGATVGAGSFVEKHFGDWPAPENRVVNK